MLEVFLIIQFGIGICLFFTGIFFLVWAVASTASLQAGSYMLLAFFIISRALLGIIGYYTENFCLLFSYGVLLLATFVLRTIIIMVRLKIMVSPDQQLPIPPLLQAAPGTKSTYIELILAIIECLQVFGCFYLCWLWTKKRSIAREEDETKLTINIANEVARYLHQKELSFQQQQQNRKKSIIIDNQSAANKNSNEKNLEKRRKSSVIDNILMRKQSMIDVQQQQQQNTNVNTNVTINNSSTINTSIPLKSILVHQPLTTSMNKQSQQQQESTCTTQTHQQPFNSIHEYHHQCPVRHPQQHLQQRYPCIPPPPPPPPQQNYQQQIVGGSYPANHPYGLYGSTLRQSSTSMEHEYFEPPPLSDDDKELQDYNNNHYHYGRISEYNPQIPGETSWFYQNRRYDDDDDYIDDSQSSLQPPPRIQSPVPPPFEMNEQFIQSPLLYEKSNKIHPHYGSMMIDNYEMINHHHHH
ncbi:hypothetical protein HUG17_2261 [Dermatophagoides farinae]|uniref:Uncharacterized protein n=1 Tax=Dermatophagoides farinae TaxID=6954 RepID=A0A9D4PAB5_DERFA|nr:hypothetical protein HUG17_2261 [Dermatophagoides farinae]